MLYVFDQKKRRDLQRVFLLSTLCAVKSSDFARTNESIVPPWWLICYSWSLISRFFSPHIRESGLRQSFCLWNPESLALESGIQFKESVLPPMIRIQNPRFTDKDRNQCLESEIRSLESRIQDCLIFLYFGHFTCVTLLDFLNNSLLLEISGLVTDALLNMRNGNLIYPVKIPWHQGSRLL